MVSTSKILTVSYGTFSCTLEGFDDSFDTMKAIAEYFRDLAADDRYFGAEPPTPDAEMLARIAEREISRRVEAHEDQGKIVLRAGSAEALPAADKTEHTDESAEAEAAEAPAEAEAETPAQDEIAQEAPAEQATEDIAAQAPAEEAAEEIAEEAVPEPEAVEASEDSEDEAVLAAIAADSAMAEAAETQEAVAETEADEAFAETEAEEPVAETQAEEPVAEAEAEEPVAEADAEEPVAEAEAEEAVAETEAEEAVAEAEAEEPEAEIEPEEPEAAEIEEEFEVEPEDTAIAEEVEDTAEEEIVEKAANAPEAPAADPDSVAAKLRRIRSVVARSDQRYDNGEFTEDEHALDVLNETPAELEDALADESFEVEADLDEAAPDMAAEEVEEAGEIETSLSDIAASTADEPAEEEAETAIEDDVIGTEETEADFDAAEADDLDDTLAQLMADAMPEDAGEVAEAMAEDAADAEDDEPDTLVLSDEDVLETDAETDSETESGAEEAAEVEYDDIPRHARVIKMKRIELDEALARGELEDIEDEDDETENLASEDFGGDSTLSPEDEAELQRELAEVEAEMNLFDDDAEDESEAAEDEAEAAEDESEADEDELEAAEEEPEAAEDEAAAEAPEDEAAFEEVLEADDTADADDAATDEDPRGREKLARSGRQSVISRIFDTADDQLEDPESNKRRNAIQHLRAAVAATRAEKKAGRDMDQKVDDKPYRSDLASVVRPRRPRSEGSQRSVRPTAETRPAPLKLVAEQRIDTAREPVRPRRVSSAQLVAETEAPDDQGGGFIEFAEQMGANSLSELLEAAAAYMSDVEGRDQFSRPMLMGKLKEATQQDFSREDGLRSFGQLLREGKLQKLRGGRFSVTEQTEFRAEARNAG